MVLVLGKVWKPWVASVPEFANELGKTIIAQTFRCSKLHVPYEI